MRLSIFFATMFGVCLALPQAQAANEFVYKSCVAHKDDRTVFLPDTRINDSQAEIAIIFDRMNGKSLNRLNNQFGKGAGDEWKGPLRRFEILHNNNTCIRFQVISKESGPNPGVEWESKRLGITDDATEEMNNVGLSTFTRTVRFNISAPEGKRAFTIKVLTIAAGSGQAGFIRQEKENFQVNPDAPPPSKNQGVFYEVDANNFIIPFGGGNPPFFCFYSEANFQGDEKCFSKRTVTFSQNDFFKAVRSYRMIEGVELDYIQPAPEPAECTDGEECLEANVDRHSTILKLPKAKTEFDARGFEVRVKGN
jgi:hypothetical protein